MEFDRLSNFPDKVGLVPSRVGAVWEERMFENEMCLDPFGTTTFGYRSLSSGNPSGSELTEVGELSFDEIGEQIVFEFNVEAESS